MGMNTGNCQSLTIVYNLQITLICFLITGTMSSTSELRSKVQSKLNVKL